MCVASIASIRLSNVIFAERMACITENDQLTQKVSEYAGIVNDKNILLDLTYGRITKLTDEYYRSQAIINKQQQYITRINKKVRNRNIALGIGGGIALGAIVAILVVK